MLQGADTKASSGKPLSQHVDTCIRIQAVWGAACAQAGGGGRCRKEGGRKAGAASHVAAWGLGF